MRDLQAIGSNREERDMRLTIIGAIVAALFVGGIAHAADKIIHDAEYYVLERQHAQKWADDDKAVDARLA